MVAVVEASRVLICRALCIGTIHADRLRGVVLVQLQEVLLHEVFAEQVLEQGRWKSASRLRTARSRELVYVCHRSMEYLDCTVIAVKVFSASEDSVSFVEVAAADIALVGRAVENVVGRHFDCAILGIVEVVESSKSTLRGSFTSRSLPELWPAITCA